MKRGFGWLAAVVMLVVAMPAWAQVWQVDAARSTLTFSARCGYTECTGQFRRFRADIAYDPADLVRAKFDFLVDVASLEMQDPERGRIALGAEFLDARKYPDAYFSTVVFRTTPDGRIIAEGELRLRGVIRPVVLAVDFVPHGDRAALDVTAHVNLVAFRIGVGGQSAPPGTVDSVTVHAHLLLRAR